MTAIIDGVMVTGTPEEINEILRLRQGERPSNAVDDMEAYE